MYIDQNDVHGQITVNLQLLSYELSEAVEWFQNVYWNNFEIKVLEATVDNKGLG